MKIPTLIHFIWAGGRKELYDEGMDNLVRWCISNPGFTINLWVDSRTSGKSLASFQENYQEKFKTAYQRVYKQLFKESVAGQDIPLRDFQIKDIRAEKDVCPDVDIVDYAIDRIDPNYGLSSDVLRYRILYKYGGVYADVTDVKPADNKMGVLEQLEEFKKDSSDHVLYVEHLSQQVQPTNVQLANFDFPDLSQCKEEEREGIIATHKLGNDVFVCTPQNPIMKVLSRQVEQNFKPTDTREMIKMAYYGHNQKDITVEKSGPEMVRKVIMDPASGPLQKTNAFEYKKIVNGTPVFIKPLRCSLYQISQPAGRNTRYWNDVDVDLNVIGNIDIACNKLIQLMAYEMGYMHVLRLEDHFRTLSRVARKLGVSPQESCQKLFKKMGEAELQYKQAEVVQYFSGDPLIKVFYEQKSLMDKVYLDKLPSPVDEEAVNECFTVYNYITCENEFQTDMFKPKILKEIRIDDLLRKFKPGEIRAFFDKIERGVSFIKEISTHRAQYPALSSLFDKYSFLEKGLIEKHAQIMEKFYEAFLERDVGISKTELYEINQMISSLGFENKQSKEQKPIQELLEKYGNDPEKTLHTFANSDEVNKIRLLFKYVNVDVNQRDTGTKKRTALHWAAEKGYTAVVRELLEHSADVTIRDAEGKSPVDYANSTDIEDLLRSASSFENK